jgi:hypothetical protein
MLLSQIRLSRSQLCLKSAFHTLNSASNPPLTLSTLPQIRLSCSQLCLKIVILVPLQHANSMLDSLKALLGLSNSKFDHVSSLIRWQFVLKLLIRLDGAEFYWEETVASSLNQGQEPELESNVVLLNKVIVDCDLLGSNVASLLLLQSELCILCMYTIPKTILTTLKFLTKT